MYHNRQRGTMEDHTTQIWAMWVCTEGGKRRKRKKNGGWSVVDSKFVFYGYTAAFSSAFDRILVWDGFYDKAITDVGPVILSQWSGEGSLPNINVLLSLIEWFTLVFDHEFKLFQRETGSNSENGSIFRWNHETISSNMALEIKISSPIALVIVRRVEESTNEWTKSSNNNFRNRKKTN